MEPITLNKTVVVVSHINNDACTRDPIAKCHLLRNCLKVGQIISMFFFSIGYLKTPSELTPYCIQSDEGSLINKLERIWKEAVVA
jgi:hypothetical protein